MPNMRLPLLLLTLLWSCTSLFSQDLLPFNDMLEMLDKNEISKTKLALKQYNFSSLSQKDKASYLLNKGIIEYKENNFVVAYQTLLKVKDLKKFAEIMVIYNANDYLIDIANSVFEHSTAAPTLIEENCKIAEELNEPKLKIDCIYNTFYSELVGEDYQLALKYNYQMQRIAKENDLQKELLDIENNMGTIHYFQGRNDSALFYFERNLERSRKTKDTLSIAQRVNNMAMLKTALGEYAAALDHISEAEELARSQSDHQLLLAILRNKADILTYNKKFKAATDFYYQHLEMNDTLSASQHAQQLNELQTKYDTAEKELLNAELEAENSKSESQIYMLLFLLTIALGIVGYFLLNFYKTKKIMEERSKAQQLKELKLMKDQELASIDAMIAGQEKERLKIASDLHDDLGSSLTAIKISIENLKERTQDKESRSILENAHNILNDTYVKVRSISHTQNSRVLSEDGWINSLKDLAHKINKSGNLDIEVLHTGLHGNLSNSTELYLFRIIQELINNIMKHANATEASINITGYDNTLDIMVDDNGKGFNPDKVIKNGMGLDNIKKRVNDMNGIFTVDSNILKGGCTIHIEIPLV